LNSNLLENLFQRKYWIFDLDGTLTVPIHDFPAIRQELGIPEGLDILDTLATRSEQEQKRLHQKLDVIEIELAKKAIIAEGALELLQKLQEQGCHLAILTRNTRRNAWTSLQAIGLDSFFQEAVVLGREDAIPKPDPDGIQKIMTLWQTSAEETVMVGDYIHDLQTGFSAGTATIHLDPTRTFAWPDLTSLQAASLSEVAAKLQLQN